MADSYTNRQIMKFKKTGERFLEFIKAEIMKFFCYKSLHIFFYELYNLLFLKS